MRVMRAAKSSPRALAILSPRLSHTSHTHKHVVVTLTPPATYLAVLSNIYTRSSCIAMDSGPLSTLCTVKGLARSLFSLRFFFVAGEETRLGRYASDSSRVDLDQHSIGV